MFVAPSTPAGPAPSPAPPHVPVGLTCDPRLFMKRLLTTLLSVGCLLALAAAPASARGLFGVVMTPDLAGAGSPTLNQQMALMRRSGVQWVRTDFDWDAAEPRQGVFTWGAFDAVVRAAAQNRLQLLPIVEFTPRWASSHQSKSWATYAPTSPSLYGDFMVALVDRYGPRGSFWAANPGLRRIPIRAWQIWNEPAGGQYDWRSRPWPKTYTALLRSAYGAVHRADRGATVVSGAVVGLGCRGCTPWQETASLYRAGFGRYFDVLAVNAFTLAPTVSRSVDNSLLIVHKVRSVMRAHHQGRKPIWLTEVTWTAARSYRVPRRDYAGFETTTRGQAQRLSALYTRLATRHPDGVARAFWFDWNSSYSARPDYPGSAVTFQFTGLVRWQPGQRFRPLALLRAYSHVAHRYAGR